MIECPNFGKTECQLLLDVLKNNNCFLQELPILDTPASDIDGLDAEVAFCLKLAERLHRTIELGRVGQLRTILDREKGADINDPSNKVCVPREEEDEEEEEEGEEEEGEEEDEDEDAEGEE
jgi:hypothetical protein